MSSQLFAAVEAGLVVLVVFGLAIWQLVSVKRSIQRERNENESQRTPNG